MFAQVLVGRIHDPSQTLECARFAGNRASETSTNAADSVMHHVVSKTRAQSSYEYTFNCRLAQRGAPLECVGQGVWCSSGVLYLHYKSSGGDEQSIVWIKDGDVWSYSYLRKAWDRAPMRLNPLASSGTHNLDDILSYLNDNALADELSRDVIASAVVSTPLEEVFWGKDIAKSDEPSEPNARVEVRLDGLMRVASVTCESRESALSKKRFSFGVEVTSYNTSTQLVFFDERHQEIPLHPELKAGIEVKTNKIR